VALRLIYLIFTKLVGWIVLHTGSDTTKDIEILVLRHKLAVLQRRKKRTRRRLAASRGCPICYGTGRASRAHSAALPPISAASVHRSANARGSATR
jgi:hypothetical protein